MRIKPSNDKIKKVEKFCLDSESERAIYEDLLNQKKVSIERDEFTYDKTGKAFITVWYSAPR